MPSFGHEILVDLFRSRGELAAALLRARGVVVEHARVEPGSIDLSQVVSTEYRADAVVILRDAEDRAVAGVVVEVQRQIEPRKQLSWPVYVTTLRATLACPVILLVVAPDDKVAAWAREPIALDRHGSFLTPVVVGFPDVPWVRERDEARQLPELAVLSAMAHADLHVARTAIEAISPLPADRRALYFDLILTMLPAALRQVLEAQMLEGYKFTSEFALRHYGLGEAAGVKKGLELGEAEGLRKGEAEGLRKGEAEGLKKGEAEGLKKGREAGLRAAVVALARVKLPALTDEELAAIEATTDQHMLTELIAALGNARDAIAARAALAHALAS